MRIVSALWLATSEVAIFVNKKHGLPGVMSLVTNLSISAVLCVQARAAWPAHPQHSLWCSAACCGGVAA